MRVTSRISVAMNFNRIRNCASVNLTGATTILTALPLSAVTSFIYGIIERTHSTVLPGTRIRWRVLRLKNQQTPFFIEETHHPLASHHPILVPLLMVAQRFLDTLIAGGADTSTTQIR